MAIYTYVPNNNKLIDVKKSLFNIIQSLKGILKINCYI